jgi:hypothetical protein
LYTRNRLHDLHLHLAVQVTNRKAPMETHDNIAVNKPKSQMLS